MAGSDTRGKSRLATARGRNRNIHSTAVDPVNCILFINVYACTEKSVYVIKRTTTYGHGNRHALPRPVKTRKRNKRRGRPINRIRLYFNPIGGGGGRTATTTTIKPARFYYVVSRTIRTRSGARVARRSIAGCTVGN